MSKDKALSVFENYVGKKYKKVKVLSVIEKKDRFLFEFCEEDDSFPVDYPIISILKENGKTDELSFLSSDDRKIIYSK